MKLQDLTKQLEQGSETDRQWAKIISMGPSIAESVLHIFEKECPNDLRPRKALRAVTKRIKKRS